MNFIFEMVSSVHALKKVVHKGHFAFVLLSARVIANYLELHLKCEIVRSWRM